MATVVFTPHLQRHVASPAGVVPGDTLRAVLDAVFTEHKALRGYVVDDQGHLRKHVVVFIDGVRAKDREGLTDPVGPASEVYVLQALSGG